MCIGYQHHVHHRRLNDAPMVLNEMNDNWQCAIYYLTTNIIYRHWKNKLNNKQTHKQITDKCALPADCGGPNGAWRAVPVVWTLWEPGLR